MQVSILIVAEEVELRETVLEMTRLSGMRAVGAQDLEQAFDLLRNLKCDVILISKLPSDPVWAAQLMELKNIAPTIKALLASSYFAEDWNEQALFDGRLRKPFTVIELQRAIRAVT